MSNDEIFSAIEGEKKKIFEATKRIGELTNQLQNQKPEDWDWITVKQGADMLGCSISLIYKKIDRNEIEVKHIGAKKLIKKSQLEKIDDSYSA